MAHTVSDEQPLSGSQRTEPSNLLAPANSCDCHIHVFDSRFPAPDGSVISNCSVNDYRLLQKRIGTTRTIAVTSRNYVTDNRCTLDAVSQLGATFARGIAVIQPSVTNAELTKLAEGGIVGIRCTLLLGNPPGVPVTTIDMIEPLAKRIKELGWHMQIHMLGDQIVENAGLLQRLEVPLVFDHMGRLPPPEGIKHRAFEVIRRLLEQGRTWVKLSTSILRDPYNRRPPTAAELAEIARTYIQTASERVIWGSDWPHRDDPTDDVQRFDILAQWAHNEPTRRRILVDNPEALYGFPKSV